MRWPSKNSEIGINEVKLIKKINKNKISLSLFLSFFVT